MGGQLDFYIFRGQDEQWRCTPRAGVSAIREQLCEAFNVVDVTAR
jgi:hypothetical protein